MVFSSQQNPAKDRSQKYSRNDPAPQSILKNSGQDRSIDNSKYETALQNTRMNPDSDAKYRVLRNSNQAPLGETSTTVGNYRVK